MRILFEDEDIIVCIKPAGVLSQSGKAGDLDMPTLLGEHTNTPIYPVHRLDKNVSGVMVYAKTNKAAASLSKQIAEHSFVKEYYALVHGELEEKSAVLEDLLFKDSRKNKVFVVNRERKGVKKAKLEYNVDSVSQLDGESVTLVRVRLHTGRTHQIRVQFASRKHPLVGDSRYGAKDGKKDIALRSCRIEFAHPVTGERMEFNS
ncbi:MAG: RluA family pseudouridine synthase [Ruminococcus sp.]|nr:RluA family pseudouridine synthase [Ruminococcus sp.]